MTIERVTTGKIDREVGVLYKKGVMPGVPRSLVGLFFGPPKTGKTTLACSGENVLLLSYDPEGHATETLRGRQDITVLTPTTYEETQEITKALHSTDKGAFDWVVADSLSWMAQRFGGMDIFRAFSGGTDVRRAYGKTGALVNQAILDLISVPEAHTIFTAHLQKEDEAELTSQDQQLGDSSVRVAVSPMVWRVLGPSVSFIGRTYRAKEKVKDEQGLRMETRFKVSFNDGELSPAGSRYDMEGEYTITPTLLTEVHAALTKGA
jgi:hypothetical protein